MYCYFPTQGHGFWPEYAEELTWWFFSLHTTSDSVESNLAILIVKENFEMDNDTMYIANYATNTV